MKEKIHKKFFKNKRLEISRVLIEELQDWKSTKSVNEEEFYKLVVSMLSTPITLHKGEAPSLSCPNGSLTES